MTRSRQPGSTARSVAVFGFPEWHINVLDILRIVLLFLTVLYPPRKSLRKPESRTLSTIDQAHGFQVSAGLAASVILTMLASASLLSQQGQNEDDDLPLDGTGILHAIWLYRNHPELERLLEQVEHPTDENLRAAGMVETRLYFKKNGYELSKQRSSFGEGAVSE
ncbi:hypothetical protein DFH08DRAFT_944299 [Mycena albidolilacea]|uniref:Uncharacterized protein n=1 Tax=Mycena albidolilacea TaxID=1033008 RepID=A0AAD6Z636_9AGAR|nr:hypothetical protein DFH08DRAFT_944299 [Mycena albidolilacea]